MVDRVSVREVSLRDGLQMVGSVVPTETKLQWCRAAAEAGLREIEVTSFVSPKLMPQFADAEKVAVASGSIGNVHAAALVPNLRGAERAFASGLPVVNYVISASDAHNQANVGRSVDASLQDFAAVAAQRNQLVENRPRLGGCIATAFGCTIQGEVAVDRVLGIAEAYAAMGADEIVVADTVGYADPAQVASVLRQVIDAVPGLDVACHFHDTRGLGLANIAAALDVGVRAFDASVGGLGGCPFAPGASGNVATEDLCFLLDRLGFETGVDIEALFALRRRIEGWLPGERLGGSIARAGLPRRRAA